MKVRDQFGVLHNSIKDLHAFYGIPSIVFVGPKNSRERIVPEEYTQIKEQKPTIPAESCIKKTECKSSEMAITIEAIDGVAPEDYVTITNSEYTSIMEDLKVYKEYAESVDHDYAQLKKMVDELQEKNSAMQAKLSSISLNKAINNGGLTIRHTEPNMYKDEIAGIVLKALRCLKQNTTSSTSRQMDIVNDLISSMSTVYDDSTPEKVREKVSQYITKASDSKAGFDTLMDVMGFSKDRDSKHIKYVWKGDDRYTLTLSRTPSDFRTLDNTIHDALRMVYGPTYRKE